jgi:CheY-like chemotaxis protein
VEKTLTAHPPRHLHILLVESNPESRALMDRVLTAAAYEVHTAASYAEARELALELGEDLDVVMAPMDLPDGDGVGLMSELHDLCGCRTVCLTGPDGSDDDGRCAAAGIDRCVPQVQMFTTLGVVAKRANGAHN